LIGALGSDMTPDEGDETIPHDHSETIVHRTSQIDTRWVVQNKETRQHKQQPEITMTSMTTNKIANKQDAQHDNDALD